MFEGQTNQAIINSSWYKDPKYPVEFIEYYSKELSEKFWDQTEYINNEKVELYRYQKNGRYFNFGIQKLGKNDFTAFIETSYCYPAKRQKHRLMVTSDVPETIEMVYIYTQVLDESIDHRVGLDNRENTIIKESGLNYSGRLNVDLEEGIYLIKVVPNEKVANFHGAGHGDYQMINLTKDTEITLNTRPIL